MSLGSFLFLLDAVRAYCGGATPPYASVQGDVPAGGRIGVVAETGALMEVAADRTSPRYRWPGARRVGRSLVWSHRGLVPVGTEFFLFVGGEPVGKYRVVQSEDEGVPTGPVTVEVTRSYVLDGLALGVSLDPPVGTGWLEVRSEAYEVLLTVEESVASIGWCGSYLVSPEHFESDHTATLIWHAPGGASTHLGPSSITVTDKGVVIPASLKAEASKPR